MEIGYGRVGARSSNRFSSISASSKAVGIAAAATGAETAAEPTTAAMDVVGEVTEELAGVDAVSSMAWRRFSDKMTVSNRRSSTFKNVGNSSFIFLSSAYNSCHRL